MKMTCKLLKIILIFIFLLGPDSICYASDVSGIFQPCQYKQLYQYYMEKAEVHLADDQPEAALQAYKMALMVQPISQEAKEGIEYLQQLLKSKKTQMPAEEIERPTGTRGKIISETLDKIETPRKPVTRRPAKEIRELIKEKLEKAEKPKEVKKRVIARRPKAEEAKRRGDIYGAQVGLDKSSPYMIHQAPTFTDFNPANFSNGIDQSIQKGTESINNGIAPGKISGEYRMAAGATADDIIWKDANADHVGVPGEKNWRYIYGEHPYNMYDKKIYSRLKIEAEGPMLPYTSAYSEIVLDPWTYVGRRDITVSGSGGSSVNMTLKYWSNARRTINETYRAENGDIVNVQENKIVDGRTTASTYTGLTDWGSNRFSVPEVDIDDMSVPIRKLWVDYDNGPYHIRLFPMANQDQALASDDPLKLSNNKIWWEESPWLDEYEPSKVFARTNNPLKQGQWVRRLSFVAKDSDYERLTFLRGATVSANYDNGFSIASTFAAPRNLWDYYDEVSSVPGAVRVKLPPMHDVVLGAVYTTKIGLHKGDIEALNQVVGVDGEYLLSPDSSVYGECAISFTDIDEANGKTRDYWGGGYTIGVKNKGDLKSFGDDYELNLSFAHMNDNFLPGLSNYRFTRKDSVYGRHIYFKDLKPENEASKIGNGIDIDRIAFNVNTKANFFNEKLKTRVDFRDVRSDSGHSIEDVTRVEAEGKITKKLTAKGMARYEYLPETTKGYDPLINAKTSYSALSDYFSDKDVWLENKAVEAGKDPSIGTYSVGLKYDLFENFALQGIYEITNDPLDMPRGLLNDVYVTDETRDGILWDKIVPFLYDQRVFGLPPYDYYNIYKARLTYYPIKTIKIEPSYVHNENLFATTIDDNVNHAGVNIEYNPNDKLTLGLAYYYTRMRDILTDIKTGQENITGHHNVFLACDYNINPNQTFTIMYGEYTGYGREYYEEYTAIGPLDTQHIVRVIYTGKF